MNQSADPCENFYEFACGNFKPEAVYTKRKKYNQFQTVDNHVVKTINGFLENVDSDVYADQLKPLRKFYKVCLESNEKHMEKSSIFLDLINEIGGFPALEPQWKEENFDWIVMSSHLNKFGCKNILSEDIDPIYPFRYCLFRNDIGVGVSLPSNGSNDTPAYNLNAEEMLKILEIYGVDHEKSQLVVKEIIAFMKGIVQFSSLVEWMLSSEEGTNITTAEPYSQVLEKYLKIVWNINKTDEEFSDILDNQSTASAHFMVELVEQVNKTKKETIANYLSIKFLHYLHGDQDLDKNDPKRFCTTKVMEANEYFVSLLYNSSIPNEKKQGITDDLLQMMQGILKSLESRIVKADWLDKESIDAAVLKVKSIKTVIGQLDAGYLSEWILNETSKLDFNEVYEENLLQILKFQITLDHLQYNHRETIGSSAMWMQLLKSAKGNAQFFLLDNTVYILNGILNLPIYSRDQVAAVKYGKIGYALAHEVGHGFDPSGIHFNADGEIGDWWSNKSETNYAERLTCLEEESSKIFIKDLDDYVHGSTTLDEVVGDVIGISMAFDAFLKNVEVDETYRTLNDHNLTKEQLFFVSCAQLYCSDYTQYVLFNEADENHPHDQIRAEATMKHLSIFSDSFKCSEGSRMNPAKKCTLF